MTPPGERLVEYKDAVDEGIYPSNIDDATPRPPPLIDTPRKEESSMIPTSDDLSTQANTTTVTIGTVSEPGTSCSNSGESRSQVLPVDRIELPQAALDALGNMSDEERARAIATLSPGQQISALEAN